MSGVYQPTEFTALQRRLTSALERLGFYVEEEVPVGAYRLDCYVREIHVAFEADGPYHRGYAAKQRDGKRDGWICTVAAVPIFRLNERQLGLPDAELDAILSEFIAMCAEDAEQRRARGMLI